MVKAFTHSWKKNRNRNNLILKNYQLTLNTLTHPCQPPAWLVTVKTWKQHLCQQCGIHSVRKAWAQSLRPCCRGKRAKACQKEIPKGLECVEIIMWTAEGFPALNFLKIYFPKSQGCTKSKVKVEMFNWCSDKMKIWDLLKGSTS
jgi:hypothetical protein